MATPPLPPVLVTKPTPSSPLRYGLFQAANGPLDLPLHARNGGLEYVTAMCGEGFGYQIECIASQDSKADSFSENGSTTVVGKPFIVYATMVCGTVGYTYAEQRAMVLERLKGVEQSVVETALSSAAFGQSPSFLTTDGIETVTGGGTSAVEVLSELELARYCGTSGTPVSYGVAGHLHVPFNLFNELKSQHVIEFDGTRWRTATGTIVSPGCYTNDNPAGTPAADGTFWMYLTGQTTVWRTPDNDVQIAPVDGSLDRTTNQMLMMAEREYVVTYECGGFAKAVTLWT